MSFRGVSFFRFSIVGLATAVAAQSSTGILKAPNLKPDQVVANITTYCAMRDHPVEQSSPTMVVCSGPASFGANLLFGSRGGNYPTIQYRFVINSDPEGTSVIVSSAMITVNGFGASQIMPMRLKAADETTLLDVVRGDFPGMPYQSNPAPQWAPSPPKPSTPKG